MKPHPRRRASTPYLSQPSAEAVAERIRTLRHNRGWSLADVENLSHGSLKAVVLGSYERGDRAISLKRLIELANIFRVPVAYLLSEPEQVSLSHPQSRVIIDLRRASSLDPSDQSALMFTTFIKWISSLRSDWNGEVLSLRGSDISTLALMTFMNETGLLAWLKERKLLITEPNRP